MIDCASVHPTAYQSGKFTVPNKTGLSKLNRKLLLLLPGRVESELVTPFNHVLIISQNPWILVESNSKPTLEHLRLAHLPMAQGKG